MKKLIKRLQAIFLVAVMLLTLLPDMTIHVSAEVQDVSVYVSETGDDSTGDGSQENPYATLKQAYAYLYSVNGANGTVDTNKIYIMGTVALPKHLNNKNASSCNPVAATISGVDGEDGAKAKLDISDVDAVRLYAATVLDNLALNNSTNGRLDIRARSNALTVTDTVTTAAGSIGILGGDASGNKFTTTNLIINGGTFSRVVGGSTGGNSNTGSGNTVHINIGGDAVITTLYGGTNHTSSSSRTITVGEVNLSINGGTITNLYMGGQCEHASSASSQTINHATLTMTGGTVQNLYAGGYGSKAKGTMTVKESRINISGGSIGSLYSGGKMTEDAGASNSLTVESAVITVSGTEAMVGALYGIGQTETDASGVNTVGESKVIFQDAATQLPVLNDVDEIQMMASTVAATTVSGNDSLVLLDQSSSLTIGDSTVETTLVNAGSVATITKQPEGQVIAEEGSTAELSIEVSLPEGVTGEVGYQWYQSLTGTLTDCTKIEGATASSYTVSQDEGILYYACRIDVPTSFNDKLAKVSVYSDFVEVKALYQEEGATYVYVSETTGLDTNDGSFEYPVQTLAEAYSRLNSDGTVDTNRIVVIDSVAVQSTISVQETYAKPATITGFLETSTIRLSATVRVYADTRYQNIQLVGNDTTFRVRGHALTMGEGLTTTGTINIWGGDYHQDDTSGNTALSTDPVIVIQSGSFNGIYGGGNNGKSGHMVFNSTIRVDGGSINAIYAGHKSDTNSTDTGVAPSKTSVESVSIEINGGEITTVYGGGYTRTSVNANSTNVTDSVIKVNGGKIGTLYAGGNNYDTNEKNHGSNTVENSLIIITGGEIGQLSGTGKASDGASASTVGQSRIVFQNAGTSDTPITVSKLLDAPLIQISNSYLNVSDAANVVDFIFYDTNSKVYKITGETQSTEVSANTILKDVIQPTGTTADYNKSVELTAGASLPDSDTSAELKYQWYCYRTGDNKLYADVVTSADTKEASVTPKQYGDNQYFCVISNSGGSSAAGLAARVGLASDDATVSVTPLVEGDKTIYVNAEGNAQTGDGTATNPFDILAAKNYIIANKGGITGNITVELAEGTYFIEDTLEFTLEDGGLDNQTITWVAAEGAEVVLTGAKQVEGTFSLYQNGIYVANIAADGSGSYPEFRDLLVNGDKVTRARTPNNGWNYFTSYSEPPETTEATYTGYPSTGSGFYISEADTPSLDNWAGVEVAYNREWQLRRLGVTGVEAAADGEVQLIIDEKHYENYATSGGQYDLKGRSYWLENHLAFLDEPGEWYYDQSNGKLYYYPCEDEVSSGQLTAKVEYPVVEQLLTITGTTEEKVKNLVFDGLTFTGTTSLYTTENGFLDGLGGYTSDGYMFPGAVHAKYAENLTIQNCLFTALGIHCLRVSDGCNNVTIDSNNFENSAMGAIYVANFISRTSAKSRYCTNITLSNNRVFNVATDYLGSNGIWVMRSVKGVYIKNNTISYLPYTAIAVGSGCSRNTSFDDKVYIEGNYIEDCMYALTDGGGIYVRGGSPYTDHYIKNNVIVSNGSSASTKSVGIYLDCGVLNYKVTGNLVLGYKNVVMQVQTISDQRARYHVVTDNYFTLSKQIKGKEEADKGGNIISNNICYDNLAVLPQEALAIYNSAGSSLAGKNALVVTDEIKHLQVLGQGTQVHLQITNEHADARTYTVSSYNMPEYIVMTAESVTVSPGETADMTVTLSLSQDAPETTGCIPVALSVTDQYGQQLIRERAVSVMVGSDTSNVIYHHTPTIDGILDPEYLSSAVSLSGSPFHPDTSAESSVTSTAYLLWDKDWLYVYIAVHDETIMSSGTSYVTTVNTPWSNDNVETYYSEAGQEDKVAVDAFGIECYEKGFPRPTYPYATKFTYQGEIIDYTPGETVAAGETVPGADGYVIEMTIPITQGTEDGSVPTGGEQVYFFYQNNDLQALTQTGSGTTRTTVALKNSPKVYVLSNTPAQVPSYTVAFESNGGSSVVSQTVSYGEMATSPENPSRDGYQFVGWYADSTLTKVWSFDTDKVIEEIMLYAKWEVDTDMDTDTDTDTDGKNGETEPSTDTDVPGTEETDSDTDTEGENIVNEPSPYTGDSSNLVYWFVLCLITLVTCIMVCFVRYKKK